MTRWSGALARRLPNASGAELAAGSRGADAADARPRSDHSAPRRSSLPSQSSPSHSAEIERLMMRFGTLVRAIGDRHGLAGGDLDDLVQETRIRLWRTLERGDGREIPSSYVYRAAMSAAVDMIRRRRARREEPVTPAMAEPVAEAADADLERAELLARLAEALDSLGPTRAPVVRMFLAGYGREEIASLLGWTEAKTRNLLYRGLADLRAALRARGITFPHGPKEPR